MATMNGQDSKAKPGFDPNFTQAVINSIGPKATPRTRLVMSSLIKHLHDFARDIELTVDEWQMGMQFMDEVGHIYFTSNKTRHEMHRICDVLGLESLVDEIANKHILESGESPTSSSILGPFWSPTSPFRELGSSIMENEAKGGQVTLMHGKIIDSETKKDLPNAIVDIWEASTNGKYDFQDPENQIPNNLRGKFRTDAEGNYHFYCLKPTAYSLPRDGPSFDLITALDRNTMRPAHIHMMILADGYHPLVTQIYPREDPHLKTDAVFAVKGDLIVDFKPLSGDPKATLELPYEFSLVPKSKTEA